ncbi:hypothetical protein NITLEN_70162 [Nitrospira lenta]|uniref:Uncharacterized protein n=1 Tax=Nitrospira lenta TaxID=1436998 RepID=A0A330L9F3_9BACT|nr:hypothetical protein NITLEN_70162 [Nitrospira lenta]
MDLVLPSPGCEATRIIQKAKGLAWRIGIVRGGKIQMQEWATEWPDSPLCSLRPHGVAEVPQCAQ